MWTISFGYYDKWSEVAWWDINQIEASLVSLPGGPMTGICYRQGTNDLSMWKEVYDWNEYGLPHAFTNQDVIVDIGAHIGSFSRACLDRGAGYAISIEPFPSSFDILQQNMAYYPQKSECLKIAIGSSSKTIQLRNPDKKKASYVAVSAHFGRGDIVAEVECQPLSYIIPDELKVRMLKLDCEGAEYEIIEGYDGNLDNVQEILGEAHRIQRDGVELNMDYLEKLLNAKNFKVESKAVSPVTWVFKAIKC